MANKKKDKSRKAATKGGGGSKSSGGRRDASKPCKHVKLPLVPSKQPGTVALDNAKIFEILFLDVGMRGSRN